jgi:hypothetical protein
VIFNGIVLLIMSFIAFLLAVIILNIRGTFTEVVKRIFRIKPPQGGASV